MYGTDKKQDRPNDGEVLIQGRFVSLGIRVTHTELRASIHRVDHERTAQTSPILGRKSYSVWHLDGHHKLIRWRFVIHAAIDGFSRTIPFIQCASNNRASSVGCISECGANIRFA